MHIGSNHLLREVTGKIACVCVLLFVLINLCIKQLSRYGKKIQPSSAGSKRKGIRAVFVTT